MAYSRFSFVLSVLFVGALASDDVVTITQLPPARRTPSSHRDIGLAQRATTYETTSPLPLTDYHYSYSAVPYQVNPYDYKRGPQSGYNMCNSTTEGPDSQCQTMVVNDLSDFCVWGSPTPNGVIGDVEAATVAYCTKPGRGTRLIPAGSITAAQFMRTSAYIQITGLFDQTGINLQANDTGGELDPHGDDNLGNPVGGLVYSSGMTSGNNNTIIQVMSWNNFVGSGQFCIKLCDPTVTSPNYCLNTDDLVGCAYNMPASYTPNQFTSCEGELQDVVGLYTSAGKTVTWSEPASLAPNTILPWQPRIPASSNCVTYSSEQLFGTTSASSASSASLSITVTDTSQSSASMAKTGTSTASTASGTATRSSSSSNNGASELVICSGLSIVGLGLALVSFF